ncbi:hypothetical protein HDU67_006398 [Dinochytrium kinnereticum]|nr:hypothetical protein HDU67_006398 [Dinochytrium kinnereticum]
MLRSAGVRHRPLSPPIQDMTWASSDGGYSSPPSSSSPFNTSYASFTSAGYASASCIPNSAFKPNPTITGKCSDLKVDLQLGSTTFVAGGDLYGWLEMECFSKSRVRLGEISVELEGIEELTLRGESFSKTCLYMKHVFQGERKPPSAAVKGPCENGFRLARQKKTTFPFVFRIPITAASSFKFQSGSLRYVVTGVIQFIHLDRLDTMFRTRDATIHDNRLYYNPTLPNPVSPVVMSDVKTVMNSFGVLCGTVELQARLHRTRYCTGESIPIDVTVKNGTKRRIQGLKVSLIQKLIILREIDSQDAQTGIRSRIISTTVRDALFRDREHGFDQGEDRTTRLYITVPPNILTVCNTELTEMVCRLEVALNVGSGLITQNMTIELPIDICNSLSLEQPPTASLSVLESIQRHESEAPPSPYIPPRAVKVKSSSTMRRYGKPQELNMSLSRSLSPIGTIPRGGLGGSRYLPWCDDEEEEETFAQRAHQRPQSAACVRGEVGYDSAAEEDFDDAPKVFAKKPTHLESPSSSLHRDSLAGMPAGGLRALPELPKSSSDLLKEIIPLIPSLEAHKSIEKKNSYDVQIRPERSTENSSRRSQSPPIKPRPKGYISKYSPANARDSGNLLLVDSSSNTLSVYKTDWPCAKPLPQPEEHRTAESFPSHGMAYPQYITKKQEPDSPFKGEATKIFPRSSPQPPPKSAVNGFAAKHSISALETLSPILRPINSNETNSHRVERGKAYTKKKENIESNQNVSSPVAPKSPSWRRSVDYQSNLMGFKREEKYSENAKNSNSASASAAVERPVLIESATSLNKNSGRLSEAWMPKGQADANIFKMKENSDSYENKQTNAVKRDREPGRSGTDSSSSKIPIMTINREHEAPIPPAKRLPSTPLRAETARVGNNYKPSSPMLSSSGESSFNEATSRI